MRTSPNDETNSEETTDVLFGRLMVHLETMEHAEREAETLIAELKRRLPPDAPLLDRIEAATQH